MAFVPANVADANRRVYSLPSTDVSTNVTGVPLALEITYADFPEFFDETAPDIHADTVLLIESYNQADGSTTFVDNSPSGHTVTVVGDTHHETDQSKFSTSSIDFDGTGDCLTVASHADFAIGTADYTIRFWYYASAFGSNQYLLDIGTNGLALSLASGKLRYYTASTGIGSALYTSGPTLSTGQWYHIEVDRVSNTTSVYVNGVCTTQTGTDNHNIAQGVFNIGRYGGNSYYLNGYIQGFQCISGTALHTSDFTPPDRLFSVPTYKKISAEQNDSQINVEVSPNEWNYDSGTPSNSKAVLYLPVSATTTAGAEIVISADGSQDNNTYVGVTGDAAAQAVYDSNFAAVYHMAQDPSTDDILDSTSNGTDMTTMTGTMTSDDLVDASVGKGIDFDGSDDGLYTATADFSALQTAHTIEIFAKWGASIVSYDMLFSAGDSTSGCLQIGVGASTSLIGCMVGGDIVNTSIAPDATNFQMLTQKLSSSTLTMYNNGSADANTNGVSVTNLSSDELYIGRRFDGYYGNAVISEVRVSEIARSATWINLTAKSFLGTLWTVSAYSGGDELAVWLDQPYNLTDPLATYLTQLYSLTVGLTALLEQPYSGLIQTHLLQYYGDVPRLRAALLQFYGDAPALEAALVQYYGDALPLAAHLEQPYALVPLLAAALEQRYGLAAGQRAAELLQHYHLDATARLSAALLQPYLLEGEAGSGTLDYSLTLAGVELNSVAAINWDYRRSRYYGTIDITLKDEGEARSSFEGAALVLTAGGTEYRFEVEGRYRETSRFGQASYHITGHSATRRLGAPHAQPLDDPAEGAMLSDYAAAICAPYGITVVWSVVDEWFSAEKLVAGERTPIEQLRELVGEIGAVLQARPAGATLYVEYDDEVAVDQWFAATPAVTLDDFSHFESTSETDDQQPGYNRFLVATADQDADGDLVFERVDARTRLVRYYRQDYSDGVGYRLDHTEEDGSVRIEPGGLMRESHEEVIEFVDGSGRTGRPVDEIIAVEWLDDDLGAITEIDGSVLRVASRRVWAGSDFSGGDSLARVRYWSRSWRWTVSSDAVYQVQVRAIREEA